MLARITAGVLGATLVFGSIGYGQQPPGGPPDFAQMRQQMMDRLKDAMGASDDEWKVMEPRIESVQQLQRQTGGRGPGMFGPPPGGPGGPGGLGNGGPGGPPPGGTDNPAGAPAAAGRDNGGPGAGGPPNGGFGGPGGPGGQTPSEVQQKQSELHEALQSQDASPDDVKAKVAALRDAKSRAKAQLSAAQEELRGLLSLRQEAVLVSFGILE